MPLIYNFFLILFISIVASITIKTKKDKNCYLIICFLILLYVHSMVDIKTMFDLQAYKAAFEETFYLPWIKCLSWGNVSFKIEPGYLLFYKAVSLISHNFQIFLWVNSIILLSLYFLLIKKYSNAAFISVLFLLVGPYNQSLFVLRQHLAAVVLLASYPFIRDRKQLKFLLTVFVAFSIHQSALVFIPVYYLYNLNKRNLKIAILASGVLLYFGFQSIIIWGADMTVGNSVYVESEGSGLNFKPALIGMSWLITYLFVLKKHVFDEGLNRYLFILLSLSVILLIAGIGFTPSGRLSIYFTSCHFLLMPVIWGYLRKNVFIRLLLIFLFLTIGFYVSFVGNSWMYIEDLKLVPIL